MTRIVILSLLSIAPAMAQAADSGVYVGAGVSRTEYRNLIQSSADGFKVVGGLRLLDSFGIEADYSDHGKVTFGDGSPPVCPPGLACIARASSRIVTHELKSVSAYAVVYWDLPVVEFFGKLGLSHGEMTQGEATAIPNSFSRSATDAAWGVGAQAKFLSFALRAEFERFKSPLEQYRVNAFTASLIYTLF